MPEPLLTERRVPRPTFDAARYAPIAADDRTQPSSITEIPVDSGRAVEVPAGSVLRLSCPDGPQVADTCVFSAADPTERLWANQTLNREGAHVTRGARLWGTMPRFRPLATIVDDTVRTVPNDHGARHHIVLGAHCNPWMWLLATGRTDHPNCYDQLCDGCRRAGIDPALVHDNVNFFQKTRVDAHTSQYVTEAPDVRAGDHVELYAEIDLVVVVSTCPMGSGRYRTESGRRDPNRLLAEVFASSVEPEEFTYIAAR